MTAYIVAEMFVGLLCRLIRFRQQRTNGEFVRHYGRRRVQTNEHFSKTRWLQFFLDISILTLETQMPNFMNRHAATEAFNSFCVTLVMIWNDGRMMTNRYVYLKAGKYNDNGKYRKYFYSS